MPFFLILVEMIFVVALIYFVLTFFQMSYAGFKQWRIDNKGSVSFFYFASLAFLIACVLLYLNVAGVYAESKIAITPNSKIINDLGNGEVHVEGTWLQLSDGSHEDYMNYVFSSTDFTCSKIKMECNGRDYVYINKYPSNEDIKINIDSWQGGVIKMHGKRNGCYDETWIIDTNNQNAYIYGVDSKKFCALPSNAVVKNERWILVDGFKLKLDLEYHYLPQPARFIVSLWFKKHLDLGGVSNIKNYL
jgi:hypothetical protein